MTLELVPTTANHPAAASVSKRELYLFDIDGVLNDVGNEKVQPEILSQLCQLIRNDQIVAFNTGRPLNWVVDNLINPLRDIDPSLLDKVVIAAEKGAVVASFAGGELIPHIQKNYLVPDSVKTLLQEYIDQEAYLNCFPSELRDRYRGGLAYDEDKIAMATIYIPESFKDHQARKELVDILAGDVGRKIKADLAGIAEGCGLRVDQTTIAFDIEHCATGKDLGAKVIIEHLGLAADQISMAYTFGDSASDLKMAEYLHNNGYLVMHSGVGKQVLADENSPEFAPDFPILEHATFFSNGTADLLRNSLIADVVKQG